MGDMLNITDRALPCKKKFDFTKIIGVPKHFNNKKHLFWNLFQIKNPYFRFCTVFYTLCIFPGYLGDVTHLLAAHSDFLNKTEQNWSYSGKVFSTFWI